MTKAQAARALLKARERHHQAIAAENVARNEYAEAERVYIEQFKESDACPNNILVDGIVIMTSEDWYDVKPGSRLSFHTVEVAE